MSASERPRLDASIRGSVRTLALVLGDQLDAASPALDPLDPRTDAVLMAEVSGESTHVPSHRQRTVLFLSAMRHFALGLVHKGLRTRYVKLDAPGNTQSLDGEIERAVNVLSPERVVVVQPGEARVADVVESSRRLGPRFDVLPDTHFTSDVDRFRLWAKGRKQLVMEYFYREQRRRLDVLVDENGKPTGGRWNFDAENRERFGSEPSPPRPYMPRTDAVTDEVKRVVSRRLPDLPGRMDRFAWPVTRDQARRSLADFITKRLPHFGSYQDAMWTGQPWLYHSMLSSSLNLKLLDPSECVDAAVEAGRRGEAPLNAVEGFVRQLIGWREFIRGVYWTEGRDYREGNALGHRGNLPCFYWTAETDMVCMSESIGQVLTHGYGHHIQRLMVTGNFALIAGVEPRQVNDWYLGMYVDAVDWVTTPNVIGMALHADGGVVGTKPYAASGRYISRMSNYCASCRFNPTRRVDSGPGKDGEACPFSTFYWDFLITHQKRFASNPRMRMIMRNVDRLPSHEKRAIRGHATMLRKRFGMEPS